MYNKKIEDVFEELKTNEHGLTEKEVEKRLKKYGENKLTEKKSRSPFKIFLDQFTDLMIVILIFVDVFMLFYAFLVSHDYVDSIVITVVIFINAIMGFLQENQAEVTLKNLMKYTKTVIQILRKNDVKEKDAELIDAELLVPGDIMILNAGDIVPADARIIDCNNFSVDESALTGESLPVVKNDLVIKGETEIQGRKNMVFSGTNVVTGSARAVVTSTGMDTELGRIAKSLNTPYRVSTPLENKITELSKKITLLIFIILIFTFIFSTIKGIKIIDTVMLCVSLAVAAIPEGLPAVITICLSNGTNAMLKRKTIVRQMSAIETIGSLNVVCSDKTGTITQNKMTVQKLNVYNEKMLFKVFGLCNDAIIEEGKFIGDPTETCLFEYLDKQNISPYRMRKEDIRVGCIPFDSDRKLMTTLNKIDNKLYLLMKGSNDAVISKCKYIYKNGKKVELTAKEKEKLFNEIKNMQDEALRVMSYAYKEVSSLPKKLESEEKDLVLAGIAGIIDPPRTDVKEAINKCKRAHIRPIMITGDSLNTAAAIAKEVGIIKGIDEAILGSELDKYNDEEIIEVVNKYSVYARVSPNHKERIVHALQNQGKVVAMTGDGVNDAPAIKDADVGIGMGITGTDVTKNVADIILLDDSFSTIVSAVEEGRRIYSNITKNIVYSLSSNIAEIIIVLAGLLFNKTLLLPIHILFIDLVTDSIPSIALSFEPKEKNIMNKKPKSKDSTIFTPLILANIITSALIEVLFVFITYLWTMKLDAKVIPSAILLSLVMQEIIYAISVRNLKDTVVKQGIFSNRAMNIGLAILIGIELLFFATPLRNLIGISVLPISAVITVILINLFAFFVYEVIKQVMVMKFKD